MMQHKHIYDEYGLCFECDSKQIMPETKKLNHYKKGLAETCDECGKKAKNEILYADNHRYLWCVSCWPYNAPCKS